jgi:hypothetical protein
MPEDAVKKQLGRAKSAACAILQQAGYQIEKASNGTFCLTAARDAEWRVIAIGTKPIIKCPWFIEQVKRLEKYPCPNFQLIKKEVWIRGDDERAFRQLIWKDNRWLDENQEPVNLC